MFTPRYQNVDKDITRIKETNLGCWKQKSWEKAKKTSELFTQATHNLQPETFPINPNGKKLTLIQKPWNGRCNCGIWNSSWFVAQWADRGRIWFANGMRGTDYVLQPRRTNYGTILFFTGHHRPILLYLWYQIVHDSVQPYLFHATKCPARMMGLLPAMLTFREGIFGLWCIMTTARKKIQECFKAYTTVFEIDLRPKSLFLGGSDISGERTVFVVYCSIMTMPERTQQL